MSKILASVVNSSDIPTKVAKHVLVVVFDVSFYTEMECRERADRRIDAEEAAGRNGRCREGQVTQRYVR